MTMPKPRTGGAVYLKPCKKCQAWTANRGRVCTRCLNVPISTFLVGLAQRLYPKGQVTKKR